jgi:hypothetical protein
MSHFTTVKTRFRNLVYLEKTLKKLNIVYHQHLTKNGHVNLLIPQSNSSELEFAWNNQQYELIVDVALWNQNYSIENFIENIAQEYAKTVILAESRKISFEPIKYQQNTDSSYTVLLERWN